ncbi:hypothetical protein [Flaviflagellibacter deserti]|uniref:Meckel syndrome type 1 protein n=1 Tax=Flaviflagellibacter deserti TaxID=2267266 RepID=A0ABV9Z3A8_9HYPH
MPDEDYEAIEAAVMDTARGRWFLAEFARRNRNADTALLLDAIERIERLMALRPAPPAPLALPSPVETNPVLAALAAQEQAPTLAAPQLRPEPITAQPPAEPPAHSPVAAASEPAAASIPLASVEAPPPAPQHVAVQKPAEPPAPPIPVAALPEVVEVPPAAVASQEGPEPAPVISFDVGEPEWFDDIVWGPVPGDTGPAQTVADAELIAVDANPAPARTELAHIATADIAEIEAPSIAAELAPNSVPAVSIEAVRAEAVPVQAIASEPDPVAEEPANVSFIAPESRLIEAAAPPLAEAEITPLPSGSSPPPVDPADIDAMSFELKSVYFA